MSAHNLTKAEVKLLNMQELFEDSTPFLRVLESLNKTNPDTEIALVRMPDDTDWVSIKATGAGKSAHGAFRVAEALPKNWRQLDERQSLILLVKLGRNYIVNPESAGKIIWLKQYLSDKKARWA